MANKRITELNTHTSTELSDLIPIVNSGETKKIAYGTLYYAIRDGLVSGSSQITLGDVTNFTSYSSSVDSIITNLVNTTSSYLTSETDSQTLSIVSDQLSISNGNTITIPSTSLDSLNSFTSSYFIDSSSFDTRIDSLVSTSGSGFTTGSTEFEELTLERVDGSTQLFDLSPRRVRETIINKDSVTIQKGMPVYVSGSTGNASHVYLADASNPNRMPATYVSDQTLNTDQEGRALLTGFITGVDTSQFEPGDEVWVSPGGGYQNTRPTGSNILVQKLGNVIDSAENGSGVIFGAGRSNDVPNIQEGYLWVGNSSDIATPIPSSSFALSTELTSVSSSLSAYALISGGNEFIGDQTITGSLFVSGTTELGGDIYPQTPQGATLGTIDKPFRELYLQSGSISIESDTPGDPSAIISNKNSNLEISIGGMLLVESGSSLSAPTGSFDKMSADLQEGYMWVGDSSNKNTPIPTGSFVQTSQTGSLVESAYISLYSSASQQLAVSGAAQPVTFTSVWTQSGVSLVSGSQIVMEKAGTYQFSFVAQITNTENAIHDSYFWLKYNGSNFPNSSTQMSLQPRKNESNPSAQLMTVNIVKVAQNDNDYIELYWTGDSDTIQLNETTGDGVKPETPSVIANIIRVG